MKTTNNDKNSARDIEQFKKTFIKRNFYTAKDSGMVYLLALVLPLLVGLIFAYVSIAIAKGAGMTFDEGQNVITELFNRCLWFAIPFSIITQLVFAGLYFGYNGTNRIQQNAGKVSFKKANIWTCFLSVFVGIVCVLGFVCLIEGCFGEMFKVIGLKQSSLSLPLNSVGWYFANLVILGILPAICEELIFRGIVFQGLKEKFSSKVSIVLSALLFALMHQSIQQFIYPFILGLLLAFVFEKTNNLIYSMLIHMFNNFTTITLSFMSEMGVIDLSRTVSWGWYIVIAIACAVVTCVLLWVIYRFYLKKQPKVEVENEGETNQTPPIAIGKFPLTLIVGAVLAFVMIVINCF